MSDNKSDNNSATKKIRQKIGDIFKQHYGGNKE